jgi:hypothetical protein
MSKRLASTFTGVVSNTYAPVINAGNMEVAGDLTVVGSISGMMPTVTVVGYSPVEFSTAVKDNNYPLNTHPYQAQATSNDSPFLLKLPPKILPLEATIQSIENVNGLSGDLLPESPPNPLQVGLGVGFDSAPTKEPGCPFLFDATGVSSVNAGAASYGNSETQIGTGGYAGFGEVNPPTPTVITCKLAAADLTSGDFMMTLTYQQVPGTGFAP